MKLNLPRPYISSSQVTQWRYSKQRYIDKYIWGIESPPSPEMLYGKQFATWLEHGWDDAPPESQAMLEKVKKFPIVEYKIEESFKTFDFLGFMDGYHPKTHAILEVKTGRVPWTSDRASKHLQTLLYAGIIYKRHGIIPKVNITWVPTHQVDNEIVPTGEIFNFPVKMTVPKILSALKEMESTALEISEWYDEYQKSAALVLQ